MPAVLEGAVPPAHFHHLTPKSSWPTEDLPYKFPRTPSPSLLPMSPDSLHSYPPQPNDEAVPTQDFRGVPTSGWYGTPAQAPEHSQTGFTSYAYDQPPYMTPHTSSLGFSPQQFRKAPDAPATVKRGSLSSFSPGPRHPRPSQLGQPELGRPTEGSYMEPATTSTAPSTHFPALNKLETDQPPNRPHSSPSTFTPNQTSSNPVDFNWSMNPLGISTTLHEQYYQGSPYHTVRSNSSHWSEHSSLPSDIYAPQPRRMYAPIAPHPLGPQRTSTSAPKRSREEDELSEQEKRRKRSDSNTTMPIELGEEDRLLLQLKDEESMPWKDIAARFQSDLGKTYQIPALQMRLKRLRERMRVWTETDVRALRMAHEYWVQNKFDIISQKMVEFGAAEKWNPRQCARKWAEVDPGPTPYTTFEHHSSPSYAPYTMSPVEPPSFMPYLHMP